MSRDLLVLALLLVVGACAGEGVAPSAQDPATPDTVGLEVGDVRVEARVAMTHAARQRGLMGVEGLGANEGMLFVYRAPERRRFWMRGCLMALDIAFLDEDGVVVQVDTLPPPASPTAEPEETRLSPPAVHALEMRAGWFAEHALGVGTRVRIPPSIQRVRADR